MCSGPGWGDPYGHMPRAAAPMLGHRWKRIQNLDRCQAYGGGGGGSAGVSARQGARHSAASQPSMM